MKFNYIHFQKASATIILGTRYVESCDKTLRLDWSEDHSTAIAFILFMGILSVYSYIQMATNFIQDTVSSNSVLYLFEGLAVLIYLVLEKNLLLNPTAENVLKLLTHLTVLFIIPNLLLKLIFKKRK